MLQLTGKESRLKVSEFKLNTMLEITSAINNNLPADELFLLFKHILESQLNIGKALVFLRTDTGWEHALSYGVSEGESSIDVETELKNIQGITVMEMMGHQSKSFDVVIPIDHHNQTLAYVLLGDINEDALTTSPIIKHLPYIQTMANLTVVAIENKRLNQENLKREVMKRELEMASEMQLMLLPKKLPNNQYLEAAATYLPHQEVGGDFYDVIPVSDTEYYICMADVSGKGMSAAIMMASFQAILRGIVVQNRDLNNITEELNKRVWLNAEGERFITMFLALYNAENRTLEYINCAHPPPTLINNKKAEQLTEGTVGLGMFKRLPFLNIGFKSIKPGGVFIVYTDGVNELENAQGIPFSEEMLNAVAQSNPNLSMLELNTEIIKAMDDHRGKQPFLDDIAFVSCRFV